MLSLFGNKEFRAWLGAFFYVLIVVGLIVFLTFARIPAANRDAISIIVGVMAGAVGPAVYRLVGRRTMDD